MNNQPTTPSRLNLVDTVAANDSFKIFSQAIDKASLSDTLRGPGPFTVFAPTDAAFEQLPDGKLEHLFKPENKEELAGVLSYHVLKGHKSSAEIKKWNAAKMIQGQSVPITLADGTVRIDGAKVVVADVASSNGVIHGIDKVNIPAAATQ